VVTISANGATGAGTASGEVIRTDGYILTNNHVIAGAANGGSVDVLFSDGTSVPATITGRDILTDLAVGRDRRPGRQRRHPAGRRDHEDRRRRRDEQPPARDVTLTKSPGDTVDIDYWREGHTATATVTLGSASQT